MGDEETGLKAPRGLEGNDKQSQSSSCGSMGANCQGCSSDGRTGVYIHVR